MRLAFAVLFLIATVSAAGRPAAAATPAALPSTVRVNILGLGSPYVVIGSTGILSAIGPDGALLYRGTGAALARTNVRSVVSAGIELPEAGSIGSLNREERADRVALQHEARAALADGGPRSIVTVPFELSLITSSGSTTGKVVLVGARIAGVRFSVNDGLLTVNGRVYRGVFELAADDEGDMIVVNEVSTHDYLVSVVGSEAPTSWEPDTLAAQAIAARTYLYTHLGKHQRYDLEGDTRDQAYDGTVKEDAKALRAVDRTAGLILTYRGAPIEALYSASAGGVTEDSENVFAFALPYLRSVPSPTDQIALGTSWGASSWRWTKELSASQLRDQLERRGLKIGTPTAIQLTSVSPTGRVLAARIVGTAGSQDIGKDRSRYYFGLLSTLFTVTATPTGANERVAASDTARIGALEALGAHVTQTAFDVLVDGTGNELGLRATAYVYELPARFVFSGKGFGHGVGMSQWGAQGLALAGSSYAQILAHYYVGTALTSVGGG
ncbi:MAG: SpoIID/LytB domain-containing protein [Chloroflexota bacterium]